MTEKRVLLIAEDEILAPFFRKAMEAYEVDALIVAGRDEILSDPPGRVYAVVYDMPHSQREAVETVRRLRAICPDVPILVLIGSITTASFRGLRELGVEMMEKPFKNRDLIRKIDDMIGLDRPCDTR